MIGIDQTNASTRCAFVAALLHYLTLSSVCWMGVEAVNLYLLIVKVFNADVSNFMLKASLAAWGKSLKSLYSQYFLKPNVLDLYLG